MSLRTMADTQLYLITPPAFNPDEFAGQLRDALDGGSVASVQLRLKNASDEDIITAARILMPLCHDRNVAFIINDRPDIARAVGADGVHIGADDIPYSQAREIVGADSVVGITAKNSLHHSLEGAQQGAHYVACGAFFPTAT